MITPKAIKSFFESKYIDFGGPVISVVPDKAGEVVVKFKDCESKFHLNQNIVPLKFVTS